MCAKYISQQKIAKSIYLAAAVNWPRVSGLVLNQGLNGRRVFIWRPTRKEQFPDAGINGAKTVNRCFANSLSNKPEDSLITYVTSSYIAIGRITSIYSSHFPFVPLFSSISREILFLYLNPFSPLVPISPFATCKRISFEKGFLYSELPLNGNADHR